VKFDGLLLGRLPLKVVPDVSGKVEYERERLFNTVLKCGALQIKLPTFRLQVKLYLVRYNTFFCRPLVGRTLGLNCALKRLKENILGLLGTKYYQNEERSETNHWYTVEKEKTNDTKDIKDQTYCIFYD
jgi:hypothetical protein